MKIFTKNSILQKMLIVLILVVLLFSSILMPKVQANVLVDMGGTLAKELMQFVIFLFDSVTGLLNNMMLGVEWDDIMLDKNDHNLDPNSGSWLAVTDSELSERKDEIKEFDEDDVDTAIFLAEADSVPNMLYCPENIFANNIAALDINFLNPNKFEAVTNNIMSDAEEKSQSAAATLSKTISSWYKSFRNIAVVGLLTVLIYLGIRILISSTAADKAKYKENLKDWFVALCLVFVIHFIMSGILMVTDKVNELFSTTIDKGIIVQVGNETPFRTNLMGLIRFKTQSSNAYEVAAFGVMYIAIVVYTLIFTFMYFKRFLYMAFFTMIAPLVALTYPIDKAGDGKSQAFNMWFKEYTMNVIIQPVHLILYTVFVSSAIDLASENLIYALVAIGFLIPAEKFVKSMFGLDKATSTSSFGSFAGGALAMQGLQKLASAGGKKGSGNGGKNSGNGEGVNSGEGRTRFATPLDSDAGSLNTITAGNGDEDDSIDAQRREERSLWADMANDENETEQNRLDAQREMARIDGMMAPPQIPDNQQEATDQIENESQQPKSNWQTITGIARNKMKKYSGQKGQIARKALVGGARIAGKATGIVGGTMLGVGAGITTGDMSKVFSYGAAGAVAGNTIGSKAGNLVDAGWNAASRTKDFVKNNKNEWDEEKYGLKYVQQKQAEEQNKKAAKEFKNDKKEQERFKQLATKMSYNDNYENLMDAAIDLKKAGVKDDMIENVIEAEYKKDGKIQGASHEMYKDVAAFATKKGFDKSNISNEKSRNDMDNMLEDKYGQAKGYKVGTTISEIYGLQDTYKKRSKLAPKQITSKTTTQKQSTKRTKQSLNNTNDVNS